MPLASPGIVVESELIAPHPVFACACFAIELALLLKFHSVVVSHVCCLRGALLKSSLRSVSKIGLL